MRTPKKNIHGTANGYVNYHCRCVLCTRAFTKYHREYVKKKNETIPKEKCCFGGCTKTANWAKGGLCYAHAKLCDKLIKRGIRTREEIKLAYEPQRKT